ncbi:MAG: long-chain-acyl-CoA synthetase [Rhizobiales bacterium]|nr:long-chain-acyl-CoA synthetase [Hyphomicrobiales bacterium]
MTLAPRKASLAWTEALGEIAGIESDPRRTLPQLVLDRAEVTPDAPALLSDIECFDYASLARRMLAYAGWARAQGVGPGSTVALLMSNRPDYVAIWLGVALAGGITALLNPALSGQALAHSLAVAGPRVIVADESCLEAVAQLPADILQNINIWRHGDGPAPLPRLDEVIAEILSRPGKPTPFEPVTIDDLALLIYTSGTTGLPKAARIGHRRIMNWALWFKGLLGVTAEDRIYDCLPLFHSVGGVVAVGCALAAGGSAVIAPKFSANRFWADVVRWDCTIFQYIGELCRYLVNAPAHPLERSHRLRIACGNGLGAGVWEKFQHRFAIPQIAEFYAATEGNVSLYNVDGVPGAIGRIPPYLRHRFPVALIAFDVERSEPARGPDGRCRRVATGEVGEAIGRIGDGAAASGRFEGYTSEADSQRKVLRDVFEAGDAWFRTGDLMRCDARGFYYFVDRIGDTYRWKGENVATAEVAAILAEAPGVMEAVVYGVAVPGHEGRAGMVLIAAKPEFDAAAFLDHARRHLPAHAVPVFIRLARSIALTDTFKYKKQMLMAEGFDPSLTSDPLLVLGRLAPCYRPIDRDLHRRIAAAEVRL